MATSSFDANVRARTRAAEFIRSHTELLEAFVARGGLESDLVAIADAGRAAEAASLAQSGRLADGKAATVDVTTRFAALMRAYKDVMAVVRAVARDLERRGAEPALVAQLGQILVDETDVAVAIRPGSDGSKAVRVRKKTTQDAIRAEIYRDAAALVALVGAHAALAERRVGLDRLESLVNEAASLEGLLATRVAKKAERKASTAEVHAAVRAQRDAWASVYRLLAGIDDPRVASLLREARR